MPEETPSGDLPDRVGDRDRGPSRTWHVLLWLDPILYGLFAGGLVLLGARLFYGSLHLQLFYSAVRPGHYILPSDWSAPLDDVFIHLDFARSASRGAPFEWSAGNGYSSGGTSLLYPLILAPGFWLGFTGDRILHFAAVLSCTCIFGLLLLTPRLFRDMHPLAKYLAPPFLLSVGALDWSLYSGMEVAFFLAVWGVAMVTWMDLEQAVSARPAPGDLRGAARRAVPLAVACAVVVATRPEAVTVVLVLGISAALAVRAREGARPALATLVVAGSLSALVVVGQTLANKLLSGDGAAAGALVKLEINDPRLTAAEVWDAWLFHVRYQVGRVTGYHVGGNLAVGSLLWGLAMLPLIFRRTRAVAVVLWAQAVLWVLMVALNGQVRWQNERYTMPALAWLLLSASVGVAALLHHRFPSVARPRLARAAAALGLAGTVAVLAVQQVPRMRDQSWFFGRASRNIRDQHVVVGRRIRHELPNARRILVGDAGAIPYASDLPALDIIGLGGYPELPFARASRWGVAAAIELIERIPSDARPDVMAIYPGWWGDFPLWFGAPLDGVSVRGNVICGGLTKMIYEARWDPLDGGGAPALPASAGFRTVTQIDLADVLSEAEHGYTTEGAPGFVAMKLLPHPADGTRKLWDAGRVLPPGAAASFTVSRLVSGRPAELVVRVAPPQNAFLEVDVDGTRLSRLEIAPKDGWVELSARVPAERVAESLELSIRAGGGEVVVYHVWALQPD